MQGKQKSLLHYKKYTGTFHMLAYVTSTNAFDENLGCLHVLHEHVIVNFANISFQYMAQDIYVYLRTMAYNSCMLIMQIYMVFLEC